MPTNLTLQEFTAKYCERQDQTPDGLLHILRTQKERYHPTCWVMLEAQLMDSTWLGSLTILPVGPNNTYKEIPQHPLSPRGLASDTSVVVAVLPVEQVI